VPISSYIRWKNIKVYIGIILAVKYTRNSEMTGKKNLPLNFYILIGARLISAFGTFLSIIAINVLILRLTDSATWVAILMGVRTLSALLTTPFIGYISDRYNRKTLMIISDTILAAALLVLVGLGDAHAKYYLIFLMFLTGTFTNLFEICLGAAVPSILGRQDTLKANSIVMGGRNIMTGLSGLLAIFANYLFSNYYSIFVIDAATYIISAVALLSLNIKTSEHEQKREQKVGLIKEIQDDYKAVAKLDNFKILMLFLCVLLIDAVASASHNVGWPIFSQMLNSSKPMFYYGIIVLSWALGNAAGIYFLVKIPYLHSARPEKLYLFFTAVMSAGMLLTFQTSMPLVIILSAFIAGIGDGTYQTYYFTYIQQVKDAVRGKVFALTWMVSRAGLGIGFIIVPFLLHYFAISKIVMIMHLPVVIITMLLLLYFSKRNRFN